MLVKAKKVYKKLPLGVKMKIRKYVLRRDNAYVQIKGKQITKRNIERVLYKDGRLFDEVSKFSKNYISKAGKDKKFKLITTYAEYRTLPVLEKTILFETFHGKSMTDNPYALFLEMLSRGMERDFNFVWVLNHNDSLDIQAKRFKNIENLIFVKLGSLDYIKYLATAKYLINNTSFPPYFVRRQEQKYLNTWHGTPLKTLGKDMKGSAGQHKKFIS
jgi:Putative glycosyl/glycerophosphate transferases involved in teichoic acid biosynthesis TagF/TagB/EpsJ/RodC